MQQIWILISKNNAFSAFFDDKRIFSQNCNKFTLYNVAGQNNTIHIPIVTTNVALVIRINDNGDPVIVYLGKRLQNDADYASIPRYNTNGDYTGLYNSAYTSSGTRNLL